MHHLWHVVVIAGHGFARGRVYESRSAGAADQPDPTAVPLHIDCH